jgi:hypothetical protein
MKTAIVRWIDSKNAPAFVSKSEHGKQQLALFRKQEAPAEAIPN